MARLATCPSPLIKSASRNEVFECNKVPSSNVIANNVPVQIIDFADGGKLISLDERDKFYDYGALTRYLVF